MNNKYRVIFPAARKIQTKEISFDRYVNTGDLLKFELMPGPVFKIVAKTYNIAADDSISDIELNVEEVL